MREIDSSQHNTNTFKAAAESRNSTMSMASHQDNGPELEAHDLV